MILFAICTVLPQVIQAQSYTPFSFEVDRILRITRLRAGPFRLYPRVLIDQIGYDTNIFRQNEDPVSDFTFTISPELQTFVLYKESFIVAFVINPEYVYYFDQNDLRGWNLSYSSWIKWRMLHSFVISGEYENFTRRTRPSSEFSERVNQTQEIYSGSFFYEGSNNAALGIYAAQNRIEYESIGEPLSDVYYSLLNRDEKTFSLEMYYPIFIDSNLFLRLEYNKYEFEQSESRQKDSESYQISSGISFPLLGKIRGTLSLGYKRFNPREKEFKGYSGVIGDTGLEYRISRFNFRASYSRNIPFSLRRESIYFLQDRIGGGISYYLNRFIRVDYNISYSEGTYPEAIEIRLEDGTLQEIERRDIYRFQNAGIVFRLRQNLGLGFNINYTDRQSNISQANFKGTFWGIFLTSTF
jgi:hypothetical protein